MDAQSLIEKFGLSPLPIEGGYFVETYRSDETVPGSALDARYGQGKALSTAIYYLLTPDTFSAMHKLRSDEVFHFYAGDPVEMLRLYPDGSHTVVTLGSDIGAGHTPQIVVPRGTWQGCRIIDGGKFALLGTTVSPGFDRTDYEHGDRDELTRKYPDCAQLIKALTRA